MEVDGEVDGSVLTVECVVLRLLEMPLVKPFVTSAQTMAVRPFVLVEIQAEGLSGFGECVAMPDPYYTEETVETAWHVLRTFAVPALVGQRLNRPEETAARLAPIKGNRMAKAALEAAVWDWFGKKQGMSLRDMLGGVRDRVPVGVSLGIYPRITDLLRDVERYLEEGYRRIKVKIKPGWDVDVLAAIRRSFGDIPLTADANMAYSPADVETLRRLDEFGLLYIEEPLTGEHVWEYEDLQKKISTPVCLDETVRSRSDVELALRLNAGRVLNVKAGRVGGLTEVLHIHRLAREVDIPLWCGGMLESGVGRAMNLAMAALPGFVYPGDISASDRYYVRDIVHPPAVLNEDGTVDVPTGPGIGVELDWEAVNHHTIRIERIP